jgi:hypothetical protein
LNPLNSQSLPNERRALDASGNAIQMSQEFKFSQFLSSKKPQNFPHFMPYLFNFPHSLAHALVSVSGNVEISSFFSTSEFVPELEMENTFLKKFWELNYFRLSFKLSLI